MILLATCERALQELATSEHPVDPAFVADVERIVDRTRRELAGPGQGKSAA